jgi:DNA-binding response OmpR family regulator
VLVVDADPAATDAVMALLEGEGCTVFPVPSFATAVHLLDVMVTGVILFDPFPAAAATDTSGFASLMPHALGVPVMMFTATAIEDAEARDAGFAGLIRKPYDAAELIAAVRAAARIAAEYDGPPRRAPRGVNIETTS